MLQFNFKDGNQGHMHYKIFSRDKAERIVGVERESL